MYVCYCIILLSLQTTGRLMELSQGDGKLHVHYSDKLVTLLREVRQLAAFGFTIPVKVQNTANTAQLFYKHGVILKQARELLFSHCRMKYSGQKATKKLYM